jgi:hypothetical protein
MTSQRETWLRMPSLRLAIRAGRVEDLLIGDGGNGGNGGTGKSPGGGGAGGTGGVLLSLDGIKGLP